MVVIKKANIRRRQVLELELVSILLFNTVSDGASTPSYPYAILSYIPLIDLKAYLKFRNKLATVVRFSTPPNHPPPVANFGTPPIHPPSVAIFSPRFNPHSRQLAY